VRPFAPHPFLGAGRGQGLGAGRTEGLSAAARHGQGSARPEETRCCRVRREVRNGADGGGTLRDAAGLREEF